MVCGSESTHQLGGEVESKKEGEEDLQGTRCQAPLKEVLVQLVKEVEAQFCREVAEVVCETSVWLL